MSFAGNSGSGKSTLLGILLGYDKESEGTVLVNNVNISEIDQIELEKILEVKMWGYVTKKHLVPYPVSKRKYI